jgi:hypothetical protein
MVGDDNCVTNLLKNVKGNVSLEDVWKDNINVHTCMRMCGSIQLVQDMIKWWAFVITAVKLRFQQKCEFLGQLSCS